MRDEVRLLVDQDGAEFVDEEEHAWCANESFGHARPARGPSVRFVTEYGDYCEGK